MKPIDRGDVVYSLKVEDIRTNHFHYQCLKAYVNEETAPPEPQFLVPTIKAQVLINYHPFQKEKMGAEFRELCDVDFVAQPGAFQRIILPAVPGWDNTLNEPVLFLQVMRDDT